MKKNFTQFLLTQVMLCVFVSMSFAQNVNRLIITEPADIAGEYTINMPTAWGTQQSDDLSGAATFADDTVDPITDACAGGAIGNVEGKIAFVDRGTCSFVEKALEAQAGGAIAVLVCNHNNDDDQPDDEAIGLGFDNTTTLYLDVAIPVAGMSYNDCQTIRTVAEGGDVNVTMSFVAAICNYTYPDDVIWSENFADGLDGWEAAVTFGSEEKNWEYTPIATSTWASIPMESTSACDGAALVDFSPFEGDNSSILTSPVIDLTGVESPVIEFTTYNLTAPFGEVFLEYSTDGMTYTPILIPSDNYLTAEDDLGPGLEVVTIPLTGLANSATATIRFRAQDCQAYFFMVDDILFRDVVITDVEPFEGWYSKSFNYQTAGSQVEPIPFMTDVNNVGSVPVEDVNLNIEITNSAGDVVYETSEAYGTIEAQFNDENRIVGGVDNPATFTPGEDPETYTLKYSVTSGSAEEDLTNNEISASFQITDNVMSKAPSEDEFGSPYLSAINVPAPGYSTLGCHYYIPRGQGLAVKNFRAGVSIDTGAEDGFVQFDLFRWDDTNGSGEIDPGEKIPEFSESITIIGGEGTYADGTAIPNLRDMEFISRSMNPAESEVALRDDSHYIITASFKPFNATEDSPGVYRLLSADTEVNPELNYFTSAFLADSLGITRYGGVSGTGASADDVEERVLQPFYNFVPWLPMTIGIPTSNTEDLNENLNVSVFPNPTTDFVTVDLNLENNSEILILNLTDVEGKLISQQTFKNVQSELIKMDLNNIPDGMYNLTIKTDEGFVTKPLVVKN